jgi:hypothetical protein
MRVMRRYGRDHAEKEGSGGAVGACAGSSAAWVNAWGGPDRTVPGGTAGTGRDGEGRAVLGRVRPDLEYQRINAACVAAECGGTELR